MSTIQPAPDAPDANMKLISKVFNNEYKVTRTDKANVDQIEFGNSNQQVLAFVSFGFVNYFSYSVDLSDPDTIRIQNLKTLPTVSTVLETKNVTAALDKAFPDRELVQ